MYRVRYFKCENCNTLIKFSDWNKNKERHIKDRICPQCKSDKLKILDKRPYYRLKHKTYLSATVKFNDEYVIISK